MLVGVANVVANSALVKLAGQSVPSFQLVFVQGVFMALFLLGGVLVMRSPLRRDDLLSWPVLLRSAMDAIALVAFFAALPYLALANAMAISMTQPLATALLAVIAFRGNVTTSRWVAIAAGFVGVVLIVQPAGDQFNAWSLLVLLASFLGASRDIVTRWVNSDVPSIVLALSAVLTVVPFAAAGGIAQEWRTLSAPEYGMIAAASAFLAVGYFFVTAAIRNGEISVIAPFRYSGLIFAAILGYLLWEEVPNDVALCGMVLTVVAGLYLVRRGRAPQRPVT
jgi:drug/metabolite transporter (DMT)-like permease